MYNNIIDRFMEKVQIPKNRIIDCWIWTGAKSSKGYGSFNLNGKSEGAHRISWLIYRGPIEKGGFVLHNCDNPPCVNPNHLHLGNNALNMQEAVERGLNPPTQSGEKNGNARLTVGDVRFIRFLAKSGLNYEKIARMLKVSQVHVARIARKERWKHVN